MKNTKFTFVLKQGHTEEDIKDINMVDIVMKNGTILIEEIGFNHWKDKDEKKLTPQEALVHYVNSLHKYVNIDQVEWLDLTYTDAKTPEDYDYIAQVEVSHE